MSIAPRTSLSLIGRGEERRPKNKDVFGGFKTLFLLPARDHFP